MFKRVGVNIWAFTRKLKVVKSQTICIPGKKIQFIILLPIQLIKQFISKLKIVNEKNNINIFS